MNGLSRVVVLADTDIAALRELALKLELLAPENEYLLFSSPQKVREYLCSERADMLITCASLSGGDGFELMKAALDAQPWMVAAIISDNEEDAVRAMRCRADGFILAPVTDEKLLSVLGNLK